MVSELALGIFETGDTRFMRVVDNSCYNPQIEVSCEKLSILPPGAMYEVYFPVRKEFSELINTRNLYHQSTVGNLPDGVYEIKYSISPNDKIWVEYKHLRTTALMSRYFKALCSVQVQCNIDRDKNEKLAELREIRTFIDAAKANVEYCGSQAQGKTLYEYASSRLEKLECSLGDKLKCH